jgi:hypothetical protein
VVTQAAAAGPSVLGRAGDTLILLALVLAVPFGILLIGAPIALALRLILRLVGWE